MATKFYAVKVGVTPGIYTDWDSAKAMVDGFPGAEYKSFKTKAEAQMYLGMPVSCEDLSTTGDDALIAQCAKENCAIAYVDGSFNVATEEFSYGIILFEPNGVHRHCEKFNNKEMAAMRNVAGEIKGAAVAMRYAYVNKIPKLTIYHDYEGIAKWCTGAWKANKDGTIGYVDFYRKIATQVKVTFVKVKGHSGDKYNEEADKLAKKALGMC